MIMAKKKNLVATDLARKIWRTKGYCERCHKTRDQVQLQGAHVLGVGAFPGRVRADLRNGMSLCAMCHRYYTDAPREFSKFITNTRIQQYYDDILEIGREVGVKMDWDAKIAFLKDVLKRIESEEITLEEAIELDVQNSEEILGY